ncbi:putative polysaccharide biosynthesis protein [Alkalibacterium sp. MB6]|uniref:putative polysaccharide biosynthesis protein n=1 Tax=Alkalibacterium sp. MB6 TaxID=2081965 RepID=UPI00137B3DCD|nr:polysaccharide biosynthesis protein [Alkalibacterium sp. MB6]
MENEMVTSTVDKKLKDDNTMVSGAAWMTAGSMISRVLGALYIIPWFAWMGGQGPGDAANALYQMGYTPYAFFLALATAGVPSAISKKVSYYNALGEYEISKGIYKQGMKIMGITGLVSAVAMFFIAPLLAETSPSASSADAVIVMRSLIPALLIIPTLSVTRGFLQGHNTMAPSAISQIIEQIARIIFLLTSVFIIRQVNGGEVVTAVAFSTFAAFVGAIFALLYLGYKMKTMTTALNLSAEDSKGDLSVSPNQLIIEIVKTSIPFIIISTGIIIFQMIDQLTYSPIMNAFSGMTEEMIERTYGITQGNAHKLIMVLTSFGTALAVASVPLISKLMANKNIKEVRRQFSRGVQLLLFAMFPAAIGMIIVAEPLYTVFYGNNPLGTSITQVSAILSIFVAMYAVLGNMLQAANLTRPAIKALIVGFATKLISQLIFVAWLGPYGMILSGITAFGVICFMMMRIMYNEIHFSATRLFRRSLLILVLSLVMGLATFLADLGLRQFLNYEDKSQALIGMGVAAAFGVAVYGYLVLKTKLADKLIGVQASKVRRKLRIK